MKKKMKLKGFVIPTLYIALVLIFVISAYVTFSNKSNTDVEEQINYVSSIIWSNDTPVISTEKVLEKPFSNNNITIGRYYYDYKDASEEQQNSIIYYEGSYIQNSGIDYLLKEKFDVLSVYDGNVIKVEDDELLGKTVEIKHDNNIISVYQGLSEVSIKKGDTISQGTKIGVSGTSKINSGLGNHLHFEIYVNGEVVNPEDCFGKKLNELQA